MRGSFNGTIAGRYRVVAAKLGLINRERIGHNVAADRRRVVGYLESAIALGRGLREARASAIRVKQLWEAPVKRNRYEVAYMRFAQSVIPGAVPKVLAHDEDAGLFVMEYLEPSQHPVWKFQLRDGLVDLNTARMVGAQMGRIHSASANDANIAEQFPTDEIFYSIRLEPYLDATARVHADLAPRLERIGRYHIQH